MVLSIQMLRNEALKFITNNSSRGVQRMRPCQPSHRRETIEVLSQVFNDLVLRLSEESLTGLQILFTMA